MGLHLSDKKHLSISALLSKVKDCFKKVTEPERKKQGKSSKISIVDCLMSGLALFGLKFPSLLQFDERRKSDKFVIHNLKTLYGYNLIMLDGTGHFSSSEVHCENCCVLDF